MTSLEQPARPDRGAHTDIRPDGWVDRFAPASIRPYLKLARLDRPIGTWLLLFPCWWSQALATQGWPDPWMMALFGIGLDRLFMYLTGAQNIRDVIPFPRVPKHAEF